jgi:thymidine kinase
LRYSLIEKAATKMMICLMRRASIAKQKVQVFKPKIDDRYSLDEIISHSGMSHVSKPVMTSAEIMSLIEPDNQVVGIDEGQFFDIGLVDVANELANSGRRVIIARLDKD